MALKPEACFGVTDRTMEISQESFRSVLGQIEAELICSDTYSHALASLQTMLGEAASAAEILIRAVSREAVKLAFQRLPKQNKTELPSQPDSEAAESLAATAVTQLQPPVAEPVFYWRSATLESKEEIKSETENGDSDTDTPAESKQLLAAGDGVESPAPQASVADKKPFPGIGFFNREKKLTPQEKAALAVQHRKDCLCELGRELRKGRQIRCLSLLQLHNQTLVPVHHIEAIENGEIEKLPQDIYVRGFIRRLGDALGLNGSMMADALPKTDPSQIANLYVSVSDSDSTDEFQMRPVHLYLGYTALMAGAVGGLAWLSQQPVVPGAQAVPQTQVTPPSVAPAQKTPEKAAKPGVKKSSIHGGTIVGSDMAPPEVIFG